MTTELKHTKKAWGISEATFFRLFVPMAAMIPFMGENAHYFFIFVTAVDMARCAWYFLDKKHHKDDSKKKKTLNQIYYTVKMICNIAATIGMIAGKELGMPDVLWYGQMIFIFGVVGLTAVRYFAKLLFDKKIPTDNSIKSKLKIARKESNQLVLGFTMAGVVFGLWFLFFDHTKTLGGELVFGAVLLMVSNMLPIFFGAMQLSYQNVFSRWSEFVPVGIQSLLSKPKQDYIAQQRRESTDLQKALPEDQPSAIPYVVSSALFIAGLAVALDTPHRKFFLDDGQFEHIDPTAGVSLMLAGFVVATLYDLYYHRNHFLKSGTLLFSKLTNSSTNDSPSPKPTQA